MHSNINLRHFAQDFTDKNQGGGISLILCGFEMLRSSDCIWLYRCSEFHLVLERKRSLWARVFYEKLETWRTHCFLMCLEASSDFPSVTNTMTSLQHLSQWLAIGADLIRKELSALNRECQFAKLSKFSFLK